MNGTNVQPVLSTPQRARILAYVLDDPERVARVADAARELKMGKGLISSFFKLLLKQRIVLKKGKGIIPDLSNPTTRALKVLINLQRIDIRPLSKLSPIGIGLYGSLAKGTNTPRSDVDMWITFSRTMPERDIALAQAALSRALGADVRLLVLDTQRLQSVRKDPTFYPALVYSTLLLYGDPLEAIR